MHAWFILRLHLFGRKTFSEECFPSFLLFGRIGKCIQRKTIIKICLVFFSLFYGRIFRKTSYLSTLALYSLGRSFSSFLLSLQSMANHPATMQLHLSRSHRQKLLSPITNENSLTLHSRSLSSSPCLSQDLLDLQHPCIRWVNEWLVGHDINVIFVQYYGFALLSLHRWSVCHDGQAKHEASERCSSSFGEYCERELIRYGAFGLIL